MNEDKILIAIVDDHQIVRDGLKSLLQKESDFFVVGEAANQSELEYLIEHYSPNIILMDISLGDASGIEITKNLTQNENSPFIIMLSMYINEEFVLNAFKAGAKGYLPKNTNKAELFKAIRAINAGETYYSPIAANILVKTLSNSKSKQQADENLPELTKREIEIMKLFANGFSNKEISNKLNISSRTVESHKNHIMQKMKFKSQVEIVRYAIKNNLIDL